MLSKGAVMTHTDGRPEVLDTPAESRLVVRDGGAEAELVYRRRADRLILVHTGVPDELGGRGIGGLLVRAAISKAVDEGLVVVPWCPFAATWLRTHPDEAATVAVDWTPAPDDLGSADDRLDEMESESFPASDSHSDWAGPA